MRQSKKQYDKNKTDIFFVRPVDVTPVRAKKTIQRESEQKQEKLFESRKKFHQKPTAIFSDSSVKDLSQDKKISAHKQQDHPNSSFYPQDEFPYYYNKKFDSKKNAVADKKFSYHSKNKNVIQASPHEKKLIDGQSFIFYDPREYKIKTVHHSNEMNYHLASVSWNNPHIGSTKTKVNESVSFDNSYARKRMIKEFQSQTLPAYSNQLDEKDFKVSNEKKQEIKINQPNYDLKRQNQNFSDLFNQELGYKNGEKGKRNRNISASFAWQEFDSVRNAKDASGVERCEMSDILGGIKRELSPLKSPLRSPQGSPQKRDVKPKEVQSSNKQKQKKKQSTPANQEVKYTGIFKWKNNYKK